MVLIVAGENILEIYLEDLKPEAQEEVLRFYGVSNPKELNLDIQPLFVLEKEE